MKIEFILHLVAYISAFQISIILPLKNEFNNEDMFEFYTVWMLKFFIYGGLVSWILISLYMDYQLNTLSLTYRNKNVRILA